MESLKIFIRRKNLWYNKIFQEARSSEFKAEGTTFKKDTEGGNYKVYLGYVIWRKCYTQENHGRLGGKNRPGLMHGKP